MLPANDLLSPVSAEADFLSPRNRPYEALVSYENGGAALQTPTTTRNKVWAAWWEDGSIWAAPEDGTVARQVVYTTALPLSVSVAFDLNMQAHLAVQKTPTNAVLRWWDTLGNAVAYTSFDGITSCQVVTDDQRDGASQWSDIVFVYTTTDNRLCYRMQRDRFGVERVLATNLKGLLYRLGMNQQLRLQMEVLNKD